MDALFHIMKVNEDEEDMMTEVQRQRLLDFELVLDVTNLGVREYRVGLQFALSLKENGLARYQEEDDLAYYEEGWM
jgi:hypothetical protein